MEIEKVVAAKMINFEETELRLGLPGGGGGGGGGVVEKEDVVVVVVKNTNNITNGNGKREYVEAVDLKLKLSSKAVDSTTSSSTVDNNNNNNNNINIHKPDPATKPPAAKAQVVGWPPVRSYRKNILAVQKSSVEEVSGNAAFVKVSMDGAPYLRKVDLKMYKSYQDLYDALNKLFVTSFTTTNGNCGAQGMKDFMNENKAMDLLNGCDYVPTYEDKDGDWMLVGDVPWEMFVDTCKRLRIMKGTDAKGLAPRAMEKCKNRS